MRSATASAPSPRWAGATSLADARAPIFSIRATNSPKRGTAIPARTVASVGDARRLAAPEPLREALAVEDDLGLDEVGSGVELRDEAVDRSGPRVRGAADQI